MQTTSGPIRSTPKMMTAIVETPLEQIKPLRSNLCRADWPAQSPGKPSLGIGHRDLERVVDLVPRAGMLLHSLVDVRDPAPVAGVPQHRREPHDLGRGDWQRLN